MPVPTYGAYGLSYSSYVAALSADSLAHLSNTILSTAISHLASGNDAGGSSRIAATSALLRTLGFATLPCFNSAGEFDCGGTGYNFDAIITLSTTQPLDYVRPIPVYNGSNFEYDAVGAIEHELDEVLGGGGPGSTLNSIAGSCVAAPGGFFCNKFGPTDLYRYSAPGNPSFTTSGSARSYLSVDGGSTALVGFNQNSSGDYGDFGPNVIACTPSGSGGPAGLIQDAFSCNNEQREDYTAASPEFAMMEAIGWDASATATVPEPGSLALFASSLLGFVALRRHRKP